MRRTRKRANNVVKEQNWQEYIIGNNIYDKVVDSDYSKSSCWSMKFININISK